VQASAILVISDQFVSPNVCELTHGDQCGVTRLPISCTEVLGQSVLERTLVGLRWAGIEAISVIAGASLLPLLRARDLEIIAGLSNDRWSIAERTLTQHAEQGVEDIVVMGVGPYVECDLAQALQFHRAKRNLVTQLRDGQHRLGFHIVNAAVVRISESDCVLPFGQNRTLGPSVPYVVKGYVNQLADAHDLRRLVVDAFLGRCAITPRGRQIQPGIWMDEGAKLHRTARIVAPAYLGHSARLGPSAVLARFANVEHNCRVAAGTVIDSASVLSHTALGRGLDVSHAVVDGNEFVDLGCNLAVRIEDPDLIRDTTPRPRCIPQNRPERARSVDSGDEGFQPDYLRYLSRAAGRLSEVFRGEV
jgi:hypothetical protein